MLQPERSMRSGSRKLPPISMSSPRLHRQSTEAQRIQHQQQCGGVVIDDGRCSPPASAHNTGPTAESRSPRRPWPRSYSSVSGLTVVDACLCHRTVDLGTTEVRVDDRRSC
jgi:hypothetical protein